MIEPVAHPLGISLHRRDLLRLAGLGSGAMLGGRVLSGSPARAARGLPSAATPRAPDLVRGPSGLGAPPVQGLRLTFGDDPATQMVVSWTTHQAVRNPRVSLGTAAGGMGRTVQAESRHYTDGVSNRQVTVHSARIDGLSAAADYVYSAVHDGTAGQVGTIRTAPAGRAPFTFTSFGDMGCPTVTTKGSGGLWVNDACGSPHSFDVVDGVERVAPLFNLLNGDLCYANLSADRLRTWSGFMDNISRSARHRPWMPAAGNHENEGKNGPLGYTAFQTYFPVPNPGATGEFAGLWYAYTVGNVRFVHLQNDDVCLQDGGASYIRGYSAGGQRTWLEQELKHSRAQVGIDWIVVCMHQVAMSTSKYNGADLGIRENWLPLFDKYGVDLVVSGHEHHYERTHPVRGAEHNDTLSPKPQADNKKLIDATKGTVHMIIGSGGTANPSHTILSANRSCHVITGLTHDRADSGHRVPKYVVEEGPWSAVRDSDHPYGFAAFDVDGSARDGATTIDVTYYDVVGPGGQLAAFDTFTLTKPAGPAAKPPIV
ncbi:MAG TPA: metallophosphoesterase family protein [Sporichthyaceae bacterium]|nr:metallophosphoesterase family protein [Sporichthyaceae bacterium]